MEFSLFSNSDPNTSESNSEYRTCDSLENLFDSNLTTVTEWMDDETQRTVIRDLIADSSLEFFVVSSTSVADEKESSLKTKVNIESVSKDSFVSECGETLSDAVITLSKNRINTPPRPLSPERNAVVQLTDDELRDLSAKGLNKHVIGTPKEEAAKLRKRRRSLKNREYSQNSRCKELKRNEKLVSRVTRLQNELHRVQAELDKTQSERDLYKNQILETVYHLV